MSGARATGGFTLIELLVSLTVFGIVMMAITQLLAQGSRDSDITAAKGELVNEGQIAQQIITGRLNEAIYVYPTNMTPQTMVLGSGVTVQNTVRGGSTTSQWNVVSDPFVAMIVPPRNPVYADSYVTDSAGNVTPTRSVTNCTSGTEGSATSDGCYRFFAYYPMRRSALNSLSPAEKPAADPTNDNQWVLMEYRALLYFGTAAWTPIYDDSLAVTNPPGASWYQGRAARLLADYVQPGSVAFTETNPAPTANLTAAAAATVTTGTGVVNVQFRMQRLVRGTAQQASSVVMGSVVSPRNWLCGASCAYP